jgi:hypothetical protein
VILIDVSCTQLLTIGSKKLNISYCPDHETIAEAVMSHLSTTSESKRRVAFSLIMLELYRSLNLHSGIAQRAFIQSVCAMQDISNDRVPLYRAFLKASAEYRIMKNNIERMSPLYFQSFFSGCRACPRVFHT